MHIKKVLSTNRRDFRAVYECEHCKHTKESHGYDDNYFYKEVIPRMKCEECGNVASDNYVPNVPKYKDGEIV